MAVKVVSTISYTYEVFIIRAERFMVMSVIIFPIKLYIKTFCNHHVYWQIVSLQVNRLLFFY